MGGRDSHEIERRIAVTGAALAGAAVLLQTTLYLIDVYALDRRVDLLDLEEGGLVTWATSSATFTAAVLVLVIGFVDAAQRVRAPLLAAGLAFISFDDAVFLHERIAFASTDRLEISSAYVQVLWPALYLPLLATVAWLLLRLAAPATRAHTVIVIGLALLVGAVGLEVAGVLLSEGAGVESNTWPWTLQISVEEGAELAGWILVANGAALRLVMLGPAKPGEPVST